MVPPHDTYVHTTKDNVNATEKPETVVEEVNPASADLAAVMSIEKPKFWSASMVRVLTAMTVGYLVSTIQGFGMSTT
jgi:hypothetical protein